MKPLLVNSPGKQILQQILGLRAAGNLRRDAFRAIDDLDDRVGLGIGNLAQMGNGRVAQLALHGDHDEHGRQRRDQYRPGKGIAQHIALYGFNGSDVLLGHVAFRPLHASRPPERVEGWVPSLKIKAEIDRMFDRSIGWGDSVRRTGGPMDARVE